MFIDFEPDVSAQHHLQHVVQLDPREVAALLLVQKLVQEEELQRRDSINTKK
jgi:hypothetical protein